MDPIIKYHIEQTDKRLEGIERKLDSLSKFRWQMMGQAKVISLAISVLVSTAGLVLGLVL